MLCISAFFALFLCIFFACTFVGTLYIWNSNRKEKIVGVTVSRDDPSIIKRRFISVGITVIISTITVFTFWTPQEGESIGVFLKYLGIHLEGFFFAITLPLLLTMILFFGPLVLLYIEPDLRDSIFSPKSLIWWRNYIVGPLSEEWVFRGCMCPLLIASGYSHLQTILIPTILFGVAHLHHIIQHLHKTGRALRTAWIDVLFQLFYTSIFGSYSSFLFLRTGHLISPFLVHWFCNFMGFPRLDIVAEHPNKLVLIGAFVGGLALFVYLTPYLMDPTIYNSLFYLQTNLGCR